MVDYNIPFKFIKHIVTDNRQYVWPIPQNKYELDRKFLNEDVAYATVDRKRKYMDTAMDPATRLSWFEGVGRVNSVSMMQLYRNQLLTGETVMARRGIQVNSLIPLTQQGPMFTKNFIPMDVYASAKLDALGNITQQLARDFAAAMRMVSPSHSSVSEYERTGTSTHSIDLLAQSGIGLSPPAQKSRVTGDEIRDAQSSSGYRGETVHDAEPGERRSPEDIRKSRSVYSPSKQKSMLLEDTVKLDKKLKTMKNVAKNLSTSDSFKQPAPARRSNRLQITSYVKDSQQQARAEQQERSLSRQKQQFNAPNELNRPLRLAPDYQYLTSRIPVAAAAPAPAPPRTLTLYDPNNQQQQSKESK